MASRGEASTPSYLYFPNDKEKNENDSKFTWSIGIHYSTRLVQTHYVSQGLGKKSPQRKKNIPCLITFSFLFFSTYCLATALNSQLFSQCPLLFFFFFLRYLETLAEPKRYCIRNNNKKRTAGGWPQESKARTPCNERDSNNRLWMSWQQHWESQLGENMYKTLRYSYITIRWIDSDSLSVFQPAVFTSGSFLFSVFSTFSSASLHLSEYVVLNR